MLNKKEAERLFNIGKKYYDDITHLIIATDHFDPFYITEYVRKGQTVDEVKAKVHSLGSLVSIIAILNYDLPLYDQLKENNPMHAEPSKKYRTNYEVALNYATEKHKKQKRKGRIEKPYIEHPKEVAELVEKYMANNPKKETYKVAALLHDTLEDTDATYPEEVELFGEEIADIVQALTSDKELQKKFGKSEYLTTKLLAMDDDTLTIKLCDRLSNIKDLSITDDIKFKRKYTQETVYILNNLVLNRKLNSTQLTIINDIGLELKKVAKEYNDDFSIDKKPLIYKLTDQE